ncbi:glycosyltransferase family 2 protein [Sphingomonas sp. OV641]|uniref:glycosyltransferase n=1 Tax=Sphingomonas sp. OV641 TaxID=1881068 RepID=UPI00210B7A94|nr:glycosyltransferase [Sphingomonas sp. OV641]
MPAIICVPARNEEDALPTLIAALCDLAVPPMELDVCIYLDRCNDGSAALLADKAAKLPFRLVVEHGGASVEANAGAARRAAFAMGLGMLGGREGLIFTTDADSAPERDWIAAGQRALAQADVVAGRIMRVDAMRDTEQSRLEHYYDRLHRYRRMIDPVPWEARDTHHFSGGANMAVRASAYRAIGGFRPLASGEDATLLDDAARAGFRVRRDAAMVVETSSRRIGRVAEGLAGTLRALDAGRQVRVANPRGAAWQWQAQATARRSFPAIDQAEVRVALGDLLGLTADHVLGVARDCPNAEAFAMRIVPAPRCHGDTIMLAEAEDLLAAMEGAVEGEWREIAA